MSSPAPQFPSSSPVLAEAQMAERATAPSPDYFAELDAAEPFTYESIPSPRSSPTLRPRAATVSTSMMSAAAARAAEASDFLERTAVRMQEVAASGVRVERCNAVTPEPVFPAIGPGLVVPPPTAAPPVLTSEYAGAVIATPQPRQAIPAVARLVAASSVNQTSVSGSSRQDRKRPRLDTPSPSPSPAPAPGRPMAGALRRANQIARMRGPQASRASALAPPVWRTPSSSHGRLAPVAIAEIEEALLPPSEMGAGPSGSSRLDTPGPVGLARVGVAHATNRLEPVLEVHACEEGVFDMDGDGDIDLPFDLSPTPERELPPFGRPLRPLVANAARSPADFDEVVSGAVRAALLEQDGQENIRPPSPESGPSNDQWAALLSPTMGEGSTTPSHPTAGPAPTPVRAPAQSARGLAALFVAPLNQTQPIPIPNPAGHLQTAGQAAAAHAANQGLHPANPGMGGGISFTPVPPGGFPPVLFSEPDGVFLGLPRDRVAALTAGGPEEVSSVVLQVHNSAFPPAHEIRAITTAITATIRRITGELNPLVVPPEREWTTVNDRRVAVPITWAVVGITPEAVRRILVRSTWSSTEVTLHVHEPVIRIGRFMFVAGGFAHDHNGSILNAIFAVFVGSVVLPLLFALVQANARFANVAPEEAVRAILASLEVRVSTLQNGNLLAAVFCDSPTESIPRWREWRDTVAACPFPSPLNSTGFARRTNPCAGCHGGDHPTHLCPFQDVQGWNAPPPGLSWRHPGPALNQGGAGQQPPPPPPPAGGSMSRTRSQGMRRNNSSSSSNPPKRDFFGGGSGGFGRGGGAPGYGAGGAGGAGAGAGTFA